MDRTKEFLRLTSELSLATKPILPVAVPDAKKARTKQQIFFNEKAQEVSKGIQTSSVLLGRLTQLARAQTLFNDPADEMSVLAVKVKNEIASMRTKLAELEGWLKKNHDMGKDSQLHSEQVVKTMEFKLKDSGTLFYQVLESRKHALRAQTQRKRMFGDEDEDDEDIGKPAPQVSFQRNWDDEESGMGGITSGSKTQNNESTMMMTSSSMAPYQAQSKLIPDTQYLRSRVDAITTVETHIAELGQVMSTLANMVASQDHTINQLGDNVDRAHVDMSAGIAQLQKYYESIRGNKQLMSRLFGVVLLFMLFFLFFLA